MSSNQHQFRVVEVNGYSEREMLTADSLDELVDALGAKTGQMEVANGN